MEQLSLFDEPVTLDDGLPQIDLKALYAYAKEQAQLHWQREFDIEIELVDRKWSATGGMYIHNTETGRNWIRMSKVMNKARTWEQVQATLLHELVHWHMHTSGLPYRDDDVEFAMECLRVGAKISGTKIAQHTARVAQALGERMALINSAEGRQESLFR